MQQQQQQQQPQYMQQQQPQFNADGNPFTKEVVDNLIAALQQAGTMNLVSLPHAFIPTEIITQPTIVSTRARVKALRCAREKYAQAALDSLLRWNETQESEREMMWTLEKQEADFTAKTAISNKFK